jgi:hypothetical protein
LLLSGNEILLRCRLPRYYVTKSGARFLHRAGRKLEAGLGFAKDLRELARSEVFQNADNDAVFVEKDGIDGKSHSEHVDGLAASKQQPFSFFERSSVEQANQTAEE